MKNKVKKIVLIIVLIIILIGIFFLIINSSSGKKEQKVTIADNINKNQEVNNETKNENIKKELKKTKIIEHDDGIEYSISDEEITPEIIVGDNYFGTQIADMSLNFDQYDGKTIEIEGLYFQNPLENIVYTFVGRYSISSICPTCPPGYSYFEYEWHGDEQIPLSDSETWIKIKGILRKGFDGSEYYYIDAQSIEVMNEKGLETVSN